MANRTICKIEGCSNPMQALGWCGKHYGRYLRHGDPTINTTNQGKPILFIMDVMGTTSDDCLIWPFDRSSKGYGRYRDNGKRVGAHRKICELAHGPAPTPKYSAAHSCGKGHEGCVNPRHLRWATAKENHADKLIHGTLARGERNGNSKISKELALQILSLKGTATQREIGEMTGTSRSLVRDIFLGHTWSWIQEGNV